MKVLLFIPQTHKITLVLLSLSFSVTVTIVFFYFRFFFLCVLFVVLFFISFVSPGFLLRVPHCVLVACACGPHNYRCAWSKTRDPEQLTLSVDHAVFASVLYSCPRNLHIS